MWQTLHPNIKIRIITSFLARLVGGAIFPLLAVYFAEHLGAGVAGLLLAALVAVQFAAGLYGGHLADLWGRRRTLLLDLWIMWQTLKIVVSRRDVRPRRRGR